MSQIITIEVDLKQEDAALQIEEGIEILRLLQAETMPMYYPDGKRVGGGEGLVETAEVPAPPAATTKTPAPPATVENGGLTEEDGHTNEQPTLASAVNPDDHKVPPAPPAPPEGVDVDSEGLPWDGRIHASSKTKLVKGDTWKLKRGVDPALVEQVKEELRATMAAAPVTETAKEPDPKEVFAEGTKPPELGETPMTFPELMQIITERQAAGTLQPADLNTILQGKGFPNVGMLASRPDIIPEIAAELEAL